jgi:hypothetical protein
MNKLVMIAAAVAFATPAAAYVAENSLQVDAQDDGTFIVQSVGAKAETDFWCAAGDFVKSQTEGGVQSADIIYRVTPVPRNGDDGMVFSMTAPATPIPESTGAAETGQMTVGLAESFCDDAAASDDSTGG